MVGVRAALLRYGARTSTATPGGGWGILCLLDNCPGFWRTEQPSDVECERLWTEHLAETHSSASSSGHTATNAGTGDGGPEPSGSISTGGRGRTTSSPSPA